jgi:hypothetical protein
MKIAVLIADSYGEPFETLREYSLTHCWNPLPLNLNVFTMIGKPEKGINRSLNKFSDGVKYSKFWPFQRLVDATLLSRYKTKLPSVTRIDNTLHVDISEGLRNLGPKFLASIEYLFSHGYEYVYKTTLSSVVQKDKLIQIASHFPEGTKVYAGTIVGQNGKFFASGANLLINKEMFELISKNKKNWCFSDYDDVALGKIARTHGVAIYEMNTINIPSVETLNQVTITQIRNSVHFRCKSTAIPRNDIEIIEKLLKRIASTDAEFNEH